MGQNLKTFLQNETCYTAEQLAGILADQIPGRSAGDRYVVAAKLVSKNSLIMEMDDGCQFKMTCEKLK